MRSRKPYDRGPRALAYFIEGNERAIVEHTQTIARNEHKIRIVTRGIREEGPRTALAVAKLRERGLKDEAQRAAARMKLNIAHWEISLEMYRARVRKAKQALKKAQAMLL